jgi:hypothetical protein
MDYSKYYNLERYLEDVRRNYHRDGILSPFDFFCIIIWKANRSKSIIAKKLGAKSGSLEQAVLEITRPIKEKKKPIEKLTFLVKEWKFDLPMATAILSTLYPTDFSVFDYRVCEHSSFKRFEYLKNASNMDKKIEGYFEFLDELKKSIPEMPNLHSLKEKDEYLWGKSFAEQLHKDIEREFKK